MKLKLCEVETNLEYIDILNVTNVLNNNPSIRDWAFIIHDKDVRDDGTPKTSHIHIAIRFHYACDSKHICQWFGLQESQIEKVKGRWSDMLKYLTHENAPTKFRYSDDEVKSNFDWKKEKDVVNGEVRKAEIIDGIVDGKIREYNYNEYITAHEYTKYKRAIEDAYKYRADKLKGVHREMECIFITGGSGTGKTTYAKDIAYEKGYSLFISSGSNDVLDGYKGEDCIILDDLRPSCMGLSDLLKMLDNNTSSTVKSRYRNKVLECKMIIITTVLPLEEFYKGVFESEHEPIKQFKRRCRTHLRLDREYGYLSMYMDSKGDYGKTHKIVNPYSLKYGKSDMSDEEQLEFLEDLFGGALEVVKDVKANYKDIPSNMTLDEFIRV